jgi:hypothetical protein
VTVRVAVWSGPRNISTAMMRAWENRPDTVVVDEPLYAAYLARTGIDHPGRDLTLASQPTDPGQAIADLMAPLPDGVSVQYAKHMAQHLGDDDDLEWTAAFRNLLRESCEPSDLGLLQQQRLFDTWRARGSVAPVIDAADFLHDPERYLRWLCDWLGIGFTDRMLSWPTGPRPTDGVWAPYWYDAVLDSTGFAPWRARELDLNAHDEAVAEACRPAYVRLRGMRLEL